MTSSSRSKKTRFLTFKLGSERYGLNAFHVREVMKSDQVRPIPGSSNALGWRIDLRGDQVPVVDLKVRLGLAEDSENRDERVLILELMVESTPVILGAKVDAVQEVVRVDQTGITLPAADPTCTLDDCIQGTCQAHRGTITLLHAERIVSGADLSRAGSPPARTGTFPPYGRM